MNFTKTKQSSRPYNFISNEDNLFVSSYLEVKFLIHATTKKGFAIEHLNLRSAKGLNLAARELL